MAYKCKETAKLKWAEYAKKNKEKRAAQRKEWYHKNKEKAKLQAARRYDKIFVYKLKYYYNLTMDSYNALFEKQAHACAICKTTSFGISNSRKLLTRPVVDHCHSTGKVRGLLCLKCNKALGLFSDNPKTLEEAIKYLKDAA